MPQLKKIFTAGKMNKDADERVMPEGEYRHAENIHVLNSDTSENSGTVKNVLSTKKLTSFSFTGTVYNITPKPLVYEAKNRIYWLCKDDLGCYLLEYNINNQVLTPILVDTRPLLTRVLNLNENFLITGIDILKTEDEDKELILWTDGNMQPCCVNIKRAKTWSVNGFDEEDILLIKKPPEYAPKITPTYTNDKSNNLEEKFLSFCYRYKYLDGEYSALSSYSNYTFSPKKFELDFFTLVNKGFVNKFNAAKIEFNTGDKRVVEIQLIVKQTGSNNLYIIETFNKKKESISDNIFKTFIFSNQKIYQALPENELYRRFDNIPLNAKTQSFVNNYICYGNYLEFFDIKDENLNDIVVDYDVSLVSKNINTGINLLVAFPTTNTFSFSSVTGIEYKKDSVLFFFFSININDIILTYENEFNFILPEDYDTLNDLVTSLDFLYFIEIIKNDFASSYNSNNDYEIDPDYAINTNTSISFDVVSGVPTFTVNPLIFNNTGDGDPIVTVNLSFNNNTVSSISTSISNAASCKSNKNYQVGIEYIYKYNRATTALTSKNNTIFIPQLFSTFKNQLRVSINNLPPIGAERYKFVVKTNPLQYQTIYVNEFYNDDNYVWAKLQADNKDKVKIGDTLNLKRGGDIININPLKIKVLDIKTFEKNFIEDNEDEQGNPIIENAGVYMKIRPNGFSMDLDDYRINQNKTGDVGSHGTPYCYLDLFTKTNFTTIESELSINQGSSIYIFLNSSFNYNSGWENVTYEETFYAQRDYNQLEEWFTEILLNGNYIKGVNSNNGNTANYADNLSLVRGKAPEANMGFIPNVNGKLYLELKGLESGGSNNRKGYCRAEIVIRNSNGIFIFETEPKQADSEIFFETEETFDIINGEHHGSNQYPIIQNQDKSLDSLKPAIIDLNFFNCFAQGNGAESYRVRDEFNTNALNIDLRPTTTSIEPYKQVKRFADITHSSEPYNESSNINGLNNFNLSTANFKELDKQYGSIQLIHSRLGDILVLQEEKAGKVRFGKQAIYTAEGEPFITKISEILGDYEPYQGNNGIGKNPESFAQDNFRYYWFNPYFGVPIRLSIDGTTEINNGMVNYFRNISITNRNATKIGAFDTFNKLYTLTFAEEPIKIDVFNCSNIFEKEITQNYTYILNLNNQIGDVVLDYKITVGGVDINTIFNGITTANENLTGVGTIVINRDTLSDNQVIITIKPNENSYIIISNICPLPIPLDIVLVVLGDQLDQGKSILNRFKTNLNSFMQYEDTFLDGPITKFENISGFEGQELFPINGDIITVQSVKSTSHTGNFFKLEECNKIKYLISNQTYNAINIDDLISDSINLELTETIQGINQNTFTGSFEFNRLLLDEKLYIIWDFTNRKPVLADNFIAVANGETATIYIVFNDIIADDAVVEIVSGPEFGIAVLNLDKTITYTHDGVNIGNDTLVYRVTQSGGCTAEATVYVNSYDPVSYCASWNAGNMDNIKMTLEGEIDFSGLLAGRSIHTGVSSGTVTSYLIDGGSVSCSIPFTFSSSKGFFNNDSLPHVTDTVLTSITVHVDLIFTNAQELTIDADFAAMEFPGALTASFNSCD